jgi:ABC-2 type transport system permease protein
VDEAGLIAELPPGLPPDALQAYASPTAAQAALAAGEIDEFFLVPADFVTNGDVRLTVRNFRPFAGEGGTSGLFTYVLNYNLAGDALLAGLVNDPSPEVTVQALAPQIEDENLDSPLAFFVPFATLFIFFFLITMSSGYMLASVAREKENRTAEVLLVSLRPRELMLGKLLGLSAIGLIQRIVWMGGGLFALDRGQALLQTAGSFDLPPGFVFWGLLYFVLGYLLYASMMAALGALAPNTREGNQFTFVILLPLIIPLWMANTFLNAPHGSLSVIMSLFPLTAPVAMMTRLATGGIPTWQPVVGLALLALTTYLVVLMAARFFRPDTLLSGAALQWRRVWGVLRSSG